MTSKLGKALRAAGVHNTYGILKKFGEKGKDIAVSFSGSESRMCRPACTDVWSPSFHTDPGAAWYNYKKKSFTGPRGVSVDLAKEWASEKYDVEAWAPCPLTGGTYIPADVRKRAQESVA